DEARGTGAARPEHPWRHRRLSPDRAGPADAEPLDRRAQSTFTVGVDLRGRDGDGRAGAGGISAGLGGGLSVMLRKPVVLITGASGEIGHGLVSRLGRDPDRAIVTLDLNPLAPELVPLVRQQYVGSILDAQP